MPGDRRETRPGLPGSRDLAAQSGGVARAQGDLAGAQRHYEEALAIREKLAPGSLDLAESRPRAAHVRERQGDRIGAEALLNQACQMARSQAGAVAGEEARRAFATRFSHHGRCLVEIRLVLGHPLDALA
ncbi:MAG: tetratricopeptide repeat protein [Armatimonadetes bacterium]|nr:tetratricopeptide repeat protein [Armatimonadota bacterium]MBM3947056.1 tetratricopeptide repeat protein [SAR202 cluster bacterium]